MGTNDTISHILICHGCREPLGDNLDEQVLMPYKNISSPGFLWHKGCYDKSGGETYEDHPELVPNSVEWKANYDK